MIKSILLLSMALVAISSAHSLANLPVPLKSSKTWRERFRGYPELLECRENLVKLDNYYSDFISVQNSSSLRFYTFAKKTINFQLTFVPNRKNDLFSGDEGRFGISEKNVTFTYKNYKPLNIAANQTIILEDEPNEVRVTLTGGIQATIVVNGVVFNFYFGRLDTDDNVKNFRYASFALASELDYQEFFFECDGVAQRESVAAANRQVRTSDVSELQ